MKPTKNDIKKVTLASVDFHVKRAKQRGRSARAWKGMDHEWRLCYLEAIRAAIEKWERIRARKNKRRARKC